MIHRNRYSLLLLAAVLGCAVFASAQETADATTEPQSVESATPEAVAQDKSDLPDLGALPIWPSFDFNQFAWIGVLGILAITLAFRKGNEVAALDGLLLAFAAVCMLLRAVSTKPDYLVGHSLEWWTYLILLLLVVYFAIRGMLLLGNKVPDQIGRIGGDGAAFVFLVAAILFGVFFAKNAPVTDGSRDGLIGGVDTADTGKLPYGSDSLHNHRSPLLYLWYAQLADMDIVRPLPDRSSSFEFEDQNVVVMPGEPQIMYSAEPIVWSNLVLAGLVLIGLMIIGTRLHSASVGLCLAALYALFPGTIASLNDTELLLGATLLTYAIACSLLPLFGTFFGGLLFVLAGLVWPWAWLGLPILLAYSWVRGWAVLGAVLGFVAGLGLFVWALPNLVTPALPSVQGFWADSAQYPRYSARYDDETRTLSIAPLSPEIRSEITSEPHTFAPAIDWLLRQGSPTIDRLASANFEDEQVSLAEGVVPDEVLYSEILPLDERTQSMMLTQYQFEMDSADPKIQFMGSLRTLIEETWRPGASPYAVNYSAWRGWGALEKAQASQLRTIRRIVKSIALVLCALCAVILLSRKTVTDAAFIGALLATFGCAFIASINGPGDHWAWFLPVVLAGHACTRPRLPVVTIEGQQSSPAYPLRA